MFGEAAELYLGILLKIRRQGRHSQFYDPKTRRCGALGHPITDASGRRCSSTAEYSERPSTASDWVKARGKLGFSTASRIAGHYRL